MFVIDLPARFPLRFLVAVLLGVLHAASFIDESTWPIEIAALASVVALSARAAREMDGASGARRAFLGGARIGLGFGLGWFLAGVSWIYVSLHVYGELNPIVAGAAVFLVALYLSIYPALACATFAWFRHARSSDTHASHVASVLVFAAAWALCELGRNYVLTGFPWLAAGYAHVAGPLRGYAPIVGVYGVSMIAAAIAAAVALAAGRLSPNRSGRASRSRVLFMLAVVFGLPIAGSLLARIAWTDVVGRPISVRLLQGNVAQDVKFDDAHFAPVVEQYLHAIESKRADLIVLPETAFPRFLSDLPESLLERLAKDAIDLKADIAFGVPIIEPGDRYFNSVVAISPDASGNDAGVRTQRYDKHHLVPFGEFVPTGFHWFVQMMRIPLGDFARGGLDQRPMTLAGLRIAFNVCYEDLFGEEIVRQAGDANILVNVSNVAWFGDSMALPQHLDISRMRSIETGRPMLRSTNTGMTAAIDPQGRVTARLAPFTIGSLDVTVQGTTGLTPYVRFGNLTVLAMIVVSLGVALWSTRGVRLRRDRHGIGVIDLR